MSKIYHITQILKLYFLISDMIRLSYRPRNIKIIYMNWLLYLNFVSTYHESVMLENKF